MELSVKSTSACKVLQLEALPLTLCSSKVIATRGRTFLSANCAWPHACGSLPTIIWGHGHVPAAVADPPMEVTRDSWILSDVGMQIFKAIAKVAKVEPRVARGIVERGYSSEWRID